MPARFKIGSNAAQRLMGFAQKPLFFFVQSVSVVLCPRDSANRLGMPVNKAKHAIQKAPGAFDAFFTPLEIFLRRRGEKGVEAARIGAEFFRHFIRADNVAFGLGHGRAALEYHALREEAADWLVMRDEAEVAHHFAPETRIEQVQNGVRDAADVLVNREPVSDFSRVKGRFGIVWIAVPVKYHDESTNVSIVSVSRRAGPPHLGQVTLTNSGVDARGDSPSPVSFGFGGSSTGKSLSGTGTRPSFAQ